MNQSKGDRLLEREVQGDEVDGDEHADQALHKGLDHHIPVHFLELGLYPEKALDIGMGGVHTVSWSRPDKSVG